MPGIVEFSNLRPTRERIVYVPLYMPQDNPKFSRDDAAFIEDSKSVVKIVNRDIRDDGFIDATLGRLRYAASRCASQDFAPSSRRSRRRSGDCKLPIPALISRKIGVFRRVSGWRNRWRPR